MAGHAAGRRPRRAGSASPRTTAGARPRRRVRRERRPGGDGAARLRHHDLGEVADDHEAGGGAEGVLQSEEPEVGGADHLLPGDVGAGRNGGKRPETKDEWRKHIDRLAALFDDED